MTVLKFYRVSLSLSLVPYHRSCLQTYRQTDRMARFGNILTREWIYTLIHLSVWAQLGVLVRTYLQKFFVLGCSGGWGPCLSGAACLVPCVSATYDNKIR